MATASIRSWVTVPAAKPTRTDESRDDLAIDDEVQLASVNAGTAYQWSIAFKPEGSMAVFSSTGTEQAILANPGFFTVDKDGPYLIRLAFTDGTGTTEQYVRLRAQTAFGDLKLVAAGERYDTLRVPVDVTASGWADEQNYNLNTLLGLVKATTTLGNVLYVDAAGGGDYTTVQAALAHAQGETPSVSSQWVVLVRPGTYQEDLTFYPFVNVLGWPGGSGPYVVTLMASTVAGHTLSATASNQTVLLADLTLTQPIASSPALTQSGPGSLYGYRIKVDGNYVLGTCGSTLVDSTVVGNGVVVGDFAITAASNTSVDMKRCVVEGQSGISMATLTTLTLDDCQINTTGTASISTWASQTTLTLCSVDGPILANDGGTGAPGDLSVGINYSLVNTVSIDGTAVGGAASLNMGVSSHGALSAVNGATLVATTPADTVFYDNAVFGHATPLTASNVQDALDEIYDYASKVRTLDDAYDGGIPNSGVGRTIVADQGAVQIVDIPGGSVPIPAGNTSGSLEVVGPIKVGAILDPEMTLDPNMWGNGPMMKMGYDIWAGDAPYGSTGLILGDAVSGRNYNLRLATSSTDGGTRIGNLSLRTGDSLAAIDAGHIFVHAGTATDGGGGDGGSIYVVPGASTAGSGGAIRLADPSVATAATLTAGGAFVGGVTGNITFGTELGGFTIAVDAADTAGVVAGKFTATGAVTGAGDPLVLTTVGKGPQAEIFYLNAGAGVDVALGGFSFSVAPPGVFVGGTWPSQIDIVVSAANEISFGLSGATGPMIYNADTGKLTVPGIIDPTGLIFEEAPLPAITAAHGAIFVSDGTGLLDQNHLYYEFEGGSTVKLSGGGTGTVVGPGASTDNALVRWDGAAGTIIQNSEAILTDTGDLTITGDLAVVKSASGVNASIAVDRFVDTDAATFSFRTASTADWDVGTSAGTTDFSVVSGAVTPISATAAGAVTINSAYTLPTVDGAGSDVLTTDGVGAVSWQPAGGAGLPTPTAEGEILYAVTAAAFVQATPLVNASGFLLVNSSGKMVVI